LAGQFGIRTTDRLLRGTPFVGEKDHGARDQGQNSGNQRRVRMTQGRTQPWRAAEQKLGENGDTSPQKRRSDRLRGFVALIAELLPANS
jgi:hypothetical protein